MCDDHTAGDNDRFLARTGPSRRDFGAMAGAAGVAMLLPAPADAREIAGRAVTIATPDGSADAWFTAPTGGRHPAVLVWPDIMGLRPAFRQMGDRLAQSGYAVLVVNQFYRSARAPIVQPGESFDQPGVREKVQPMLKALGADGTVRDARAFAAFLDKQPEVDARRGMGVTGYCMGGPMMMRTAAALPERVRAGGSFHGASLVTDKPDSPHLLVPRMKGRYLFAIAANDDQRAPTDKDALRKAFADARVPAEIEVYAGTMHGWCPPDSRVYDQAQADKAWARLLATFDAALA